MDQLRTWQRFDDRTEPGQLCALAAERLSRDPIVSTRPATIPSDFVRTPKGTATTQSALGRVLLDLTGGAPDAAKRVVTVSPDMSSTTDLGGWVNKVGVWYPAEPPHNWFADDTETILPIGVLDDPSLNAPSNRGPTASTPTGNRFWSVPRPA